VTVVVPVYRGLDDVRACLASLRRHAAGCATDHDVLLIDDASPEPGMAALLDGLAGGATGGPTVRVLHNAQNLGFAGTVNRGFAESDGDVVVLNADTVVTAGWLDRLAATAATATDVATVTPLTNAGSICTVPRAVIATFDLDGDQPRIDDCAAHVAAESLNLRPAVITGVGFCLYVTRAALDDVGPFDAETFAAGYGEEVDFCLRAGARGWRHLVDDATFVFHRQGGSFGAARDERRATSAALLHQRYPTFGAENAAERARDPLAVPFAALELGLHRRRPDRPLVLHLLHNSPEELGGTETHLRTLVEALWQEFDVAVLHPVRGGFVLRITFEDRHGTRAEQELHLPGAPELDAPAGTGGPAGEEVLDEHAAEALRLALALEDVAAVHLQNLVGHSLAPLAVLADFPGPVVCSVRDLYLACPHHWLLYRNAEPCGIPEDRSLCARCLPEAKGLPVEYLETFRDTVTRWLDTVDHWVFSTRSAADYFARVYDVPEERVQLIPHGATIPLGPRDGDADLPDTDAVLTGPLRLAFVGRGWAKKGLGVVNHLVADLATMDEDAVDVEVHHFGELREAAHPDLVLHGTYDNRDLPGLLHRAGMHVVLLPGPYAETFGHVMTEALVAGLPVIGAGYGALGERIRAEAVGWTIEPTDADGVRDLVVNLARCRPEVRRATRQARRVALRTVAETADRYAALYRAPAPAGREPTWEATT
jgi:GT2 family glycosyltransferase